MVKSVYAKTTLLLLGAVTALILFFNNPSETIWLPKCLIYTLTGYRCPSCGVTRAAYHLLHGHPYQALMLNPMMPVLAGLAAVIIYRYLAPGRPATNNTLLVYAYIAIYCIWGITRNIIGI